MKRRVVLALLLILVCEGRALSATVPHVLGQWPGIPGSGDVSDLSLVGNTLFANNAVVDVADATNMRRVGTIRHEALRHTSAGPYLLDYYAGPLSLRDVSNRTSPVEIARLDGNFLAAAVSWPFVYTLNAETPGLLVYNFTDPRNPTLVPGENLGGNWQYLKVEGHVMVGLDLSAGNSIATWWFFDITDPSRPIRRGSYPSPSGIYYPPPPTDVRGHFLYTCESRNLEIVDISDLMNPRKVGQFPLEIFPPAYSAMDVAALGDFVWVSISNWGIEIVDVTNPAEPKKAGLFEGVKYGPHLRRGNELFCSDLAGVTVFDATDPANPTVKGTIITNPYFGNVTMLGEQAILHAWHGPSAVLNVADPTWPRKIASFPESYSAQMMGNKLLMLDRQRTLHLFDSANVETARELSSLAFDDVGLQLLPVGTDRVYVSSSNTIQVVNLSNPNAMAVESSVKSPAWNVRMARTGTRLVATSDYVDSYLSILDITDPAHPTVMSTVTNKADNTFFIDVAAAGNAVYVCNSGEILMFEISDSRDLIDRGSMNVYGQNVAVAGQRLVAMVSGGLKVYDITEPFVPALVSEVNQKLPLNMGGLKLSPSGDVAYIAAGTGGLITARLSGEAPAQPRVNIVDEGEMHRVHWSADFLGYTLMSAPSVNGPWSAEGLFGVPRPYTPFFDGTFGNQAGPRFYKLQK